MRSNKTILVLFIILAIFVGARYGLAWFNNRASEDNSYQSWWQNVDPNAVTSIIINKNDSRITLDKQADQNWKVNNEYPGNSSTINEWLPKLITPTTPEIVAESVMQYEKLGIATSSAVLTINGQKQVTIGLTTLGGRYVKLQNNDAVYLIKDLPAHLDSISIFDWINKTIVSLDQNSINKITWTQGKQLFSITKKESDWTNQEGKLIDIASINPTLLSLQSLTVEGLVSDAQFQELPQEPAVTITVDQNGQNPVILTLFEGKNIKAISTSLSNGTYVINDSMYNSFVLQPTDVKEKIEQE